MSNLKFYPIIFAGAGPGDPDLITIKGQKALNECDIVIYTGSLVPECMLKWANIKALKISSASMYLEQVIEIMEKAYKESKKVVRLHTGDPSLYGAIFEQIEELSKRTIPYEIIPGVTSAFAAAAAMGIEYTLPEISQTLIITRMGGKTPVPESENLALLAKHQTSMVIYLSISFIDEVVEILKNTYGKNSICAVAFRVSQPEEKIIKAKLKDIVEIVKKEKITKQALIIVGKILETSLDGLLYKSKLYDKDFSHGFRTGKI